MDTVTGPRPARSSGPSIRDRAYRTILRRDCPLETRRVIEDLLRELDRPPRFDWISEQFNLTAAENKVLELLCQGNAIKDIADIIGCKSTTVRVHVQNIYRKANVNHIAGLMALVIRGPIALPT